MKIEVTNTPVIIPSLSAVDVVPGDHIKRRGTDYRYVVLSCSRLKINMIRDIGSRPLPDKQFTWELPAMMVEEYERIAPIGTPTTVTISFP